MSVPLRTRLGRRRSDEGSLLLLFMAVLITVTTFAYIQALTGSQRIRQAQATSVNSDIATAEQHAWERVEANLAGIIDTHRDANAGPGNWEVLRWHTTGDRDPPAPACGEDASGTTDCWRVETATGPADGDEVTVRISIAVRCSQPPDDSRSACQGFVSRSRTYRQRSFTSFGQHYDTALLPACDADTPERWPNDLRTLLPVSVAPDTSEESASEPPSPEFCSRRNSTWACGQGDNREDNECGDPLSLSFWPGYRFEADVHTNDPGIQFCGAPKIGDPVDGEEVEFFSTGGESTQKCPELESGSTEPPPRVLPSESLEVLSADGTPPRCPAVDTRSTATTLLNGDTWNARGDVQKQFERRVPAGMGWLRGGLHAATKRMPVEARPPDTAPTDISKLNITQASLDMNDPRLEDGDVVWSSADLTIIRGTLQADRNISITIVAAGNVRLLAADIGTQSVFGVHPDDSNSAVAVVAGCSVDVYPMNWATSKVVVNRVAVLAPAGVVFSRYWDDCPDTATTTPDNRPRGWPARGWPLPTPLDAVPTNDTLLKYDEHVAMEGLTGNDIRVAPCSAPVSVSDSDADNPCSDAPSQPTVQWVGSIASRWRLVVGQHLTDGTRLSGYEECVQSPDDWALTTFPWWPEPAGGTWEPK